MQSAPLVLVERYRWHPNSLCLLLLLTLIAPLAWGQGPEIVIDPNATGATNVFAGATQLTNPQPANLDLGSDNLDIGATGNGELLIADGATVDNGFGTLGDATGSSGAVTVTGAGSTWANAENLRVGRSGTGVLNVEDGAIVTNTVGWLGIGSQASGTATVTGLGSSWTSSSTLNVGAAGAGVLRIENGGSVSNAIGLIGRDAGSSGGVTVDGAGSSWMNLGSRLAVGESGAGTLAITNGGSATVLEAADTFIGQNSTATGVVTVDGTDSSLDGGDDIFVGFTGAGELHVQNGGSATARSVTLTRNSGSTGVLAVADLGSELTVDEALYIGREGVGALMVQNGGFISSGLAVVALDLGSIGEVVIDGEGSTWTNAGPLAIGGGSVEIPGTGGIGGTASVRLQNGGQLNTTGALEIWEGSSVSVDGTLRIDGPSPSGNDSATANSPGSLVVGDSMVGSLEITNGGRVFSRRGTLGNQLGSLGTALVDGAGSLWQEDTGIVVGKEGVGGLTVTGGAAVVTTNADFGDEPGSFGAVTVAGSGTTWTQTDRLIVGSSGESSLFVVDGAVMSVLGERIRVGSLGGAGRVLVAGEGSRIDGTAPLVVGEFGGVGQLMIRDGGVVSASGVRIGDAVFTQGVPDFSTGVVTVSGEGARLETESVLVGTGGSVSGLSVDEGGVVSVTSADGVSGVVEVNAFSRLNMRGGTIEANQVTINLNGQIAGHGVIDANILSFVPLLVSGGTLELRGSSIDLRLQTQVTNTGTLITPVLGAGTIITGGALVATGTRLERNQQLLGHGIIVGELEGPGINQLAAAPDGTVDFRGTVDVGAETARIYSEGRPTINGEMRFADGSLAMPFDLLLLGGTGAIVGYADLTSYRFQGDLGSEIRATGGELTIGDASNPSGFYSNGSLQVASGATLRLHDANDAVLDSAAIVSLGDVSGSGSLVAPNGLTLDFGANGKGYGTIDTPNNATTPFVNNGHIAGDSLAEPITLTGYVKGVGTLDNVVITGTDAPGFSPATVNRGSVAYSGTLEIEIGGTGAGQHDRLNHILGDGNAQLGGQLLVSLIDGYEPAAGDVFDFLTATGVLTGVFATESLPEFANGLYFDVLYGADAVRLAVAGIEGDYNFDGIVNAADYAVWRDGLGTTYVEADFDIWVSNFGLTALVSSLPASNATSVPEPASALLLLGCLAICVRTGEIGSHKATGRRALTR